MQALLLGALITLVVAQSAGPAPYSQAEKNALLAQHNAERAIYLLDNYVWDDDLAAVAAAYATNCDFDHNPNRAAEYQALAGGTSSVGENLFAGWAFNAGSIQGWIDEKEGWNCADGSCSGTCGHWTQMIWNTSTAVGCARQYCSTNSPFTNFPDWTFVICNYLVSQTSRRPTDYCPPPPAPSCFHEETKVVYQDAVYTLKQFQDTSSSPCVIPHVYKVDGLKIKTSCKAPLRVTPEHLVFTHKGLVAASTILPGDFIYSDMEEKHTCEVTSIETETSQKYFGLNCEESTVLANGYKTSTFGVIHTLPSLWMKYVSKLIGVSSASALGDHIANFFAMFF